MGRSVSNSAGRARSPVFERTRSWAGHQPWQDPDGRRYWSIGRSSVYSSGEKVRFTLPSENRVRRESGVPDFTHHSLVPWSMASVISQGTSWLAGFVYAAGMIGNG